MESPRFPFLRISSPRCHTSHRVMLDRDTSVWTPYVAALLRPSHCPPDLSKSPTITALVLPEKEGRIPFHCHDKSLLLVPFDSTQLSIYDPTPSTVMVQCSRTTAAEASSYPLVLGPNAEPSTPLQSHVYPYRHLRRSRDSDDDNDNDRDLRQGRLHYLRLGLQDRKKRKMK